MISHAYLVLKLGNFLLCLHDELLEARFVFLLFDELRLQMIVLFPLPSDLVGELLEVGHDEGINHLDVLVILSGQVVLHEPDLLP